MKSISMSVAAFASMTLAGLAEADEHTLIIPDTKPFTVEKNVLVRVSGRGIAGSKIEAAVTGPAKIEATSVVRQLKDGKPLLGNVVKEFDVKPTGLGSVVVTVTVTPPQPGSEAKVTRYEFEVQ